MATLLYYLRLGGKTAFAALGGAIVLYLLFVLRPWKRRALPKAEKAKWMLTLWYACMLSLLVFVEGRTQGRMPPFSAALLRPFDAVRRSLIGGDRHELVLLVLNVLAFVPLGLLLVWHARGRGNGRRLYGLAALVPLLVELIQFATGLGFLELDDWIANTLGGVWGLCLGEYYVNLRARKKAPLWPWGAALPLVLAGLGVVWWLARPLGFLPQDFADPAQARPAAVAVERLEGLPTGQLLIYRLQRPGRDAAEARADRLFGALGLTRRTDMSNVYDDFSVYWAEDSNAYVWVYYDGGFKLTAQEELFSGASAEEIVLRLLDEAGFAFPPPSAAEEGRLVWDFVENGTLICDGEIVCTPRSGGLLCVESRLRVLTAVKERPALDAAAVSENLLRGRFSTAEGSVGERLDCLRCSVVYAADSKGFYRPLYAIDGESGGAPVTLLTPAA